jgi:hypothetical protein
VLGGESRSKQPDGLNDRKKPPVIQEDYHSCQGVSQRQEEESIGGVIAESQPLSRQRLSSALPLPSFR